SDTAHVRPKAFSNIRIQDPNTFLCAENATNVQARESVCHGKNCIVGQKAYNVNVFSFRIRNFVTPIIESVRTPARITPYPTGRLFGGGAVPGTSCQATIAPSLRDISQQALSSMTLLQVTAVQIKR